VRAPVPAAPGGGFDLPATGDKETKR
jgi:hypothetical protein